MLKVALSPVSVEGAAGNLEAELPGWDFEGTAKSAHEMWNKELGKVRIRDSRVSNGDAQTRDALKCFYTVNKNALIHHEPFAVSEQTLKYAIRAADDMGRRYLERREREEHI